LLRGKYKPDHMFVIKPEEAKVLDARRKVRLDDDVALNYAAS
jgi:hypothetical protein